MQRDSKIGLLNRREWLSASAFAGGAFLNGFDKLLMLRLVETRGQRKDGFANGKRLGTVPFTQEANVPMETVQGAELDGRLYTDLSTLNPQIEAAPTEQFYIRTRASDLLDMQKPWRVRVSGLVARPFEFAFEEVRAKVKPMGLHLMECAGNTRGAHFGLMSVADWAGTPMSELLEGAKTKLGANRVLVSGFDTYASKSASSTPGASWIFTQEELKSAKAFLATEMNGAPLTKDHGAPIRLVVPGWYGCACIKWVNEITFADDNAAATSQMEEYAARTMQTGVPHLAREYKPATIDPAAMPIRIEKWLVSEKIKYRVVGVLWGGSLPVKQLEIRFNPDEDYAAVNELQPGSNDAWRFWMHEWTPRRPDTYLIRLRVSDPASVARRLDAGYYVRSVEIQEV